MKVSGLGRALRYFIRQAEILVLCLAAGSVAVSGYIWLINDNGFSLQEMLESVPSAIVFITIMALFSSSMSSAQYWYSLPVSFGCRRKNAFLGNLVMDMLFIAQSMVLYLITVHMLQTDFFYIRTMVILTLYLVVEGLSKLLGIAAMKWGKAVYIVMMVTIVLVSMFCGMMIVFLSENRGAVSLTDISGKYLEFPWKWLGLLMGAAVCAAANIAAYRILRRFEVKA